METCNASGPRLISPKNASCNGAPGGRVNDLIGFPAKTAEMSSEGTNRPSLPRRGVTPSGHTHLINSQRFRGQVAVKTTRVFLAPVNKDLVHQGREREREKKNLQRAGSEADGWGSKHVFRMDRNSHFYPLSPAYRSDNDIVAGCAALLSTKRPCSPRKECSIGGLRCRNSRIAAANFLSLQNAHSKLQKRV